MLLELLLLGGVAHAIRKSEQKKAKKNHKKPPPSLYDEMKIKVQNFDLDKMIQPLVGDSQRQSIKAFFGETVENEKSEEEKEANRDLAISTTSFGLAMGGALFYPPFSLLSVPGWIYVSVPVFQKSYQSLSNNKKADVHTLSAVTAITCFLSGYYAIGNMAAFFYVLNKKLLLKVKNHSQEHFIEIFNQHPRFVWVLVNGIEVKTAFEDIQKGDIVVVNAGETIPVDGTIREGMASVDQHILTGEAQPVEKEIGDQVFASTVIFSGRISIQVETAGEETIVAKIGHILNQMANFKGEWQLQGEELEEKTVLPTLILGGISLPILGPMGAAAVVNAHFGYRMSVVSSIGILSYFRLMSQNGILIKDGRALELLTQVDTIVFDKTGTLTLSQPYVGEIHSCSDYESDEILAYAAAAEYKQNHPIALAILQEAQNQELSLPEIDDAEYQVGYGIKVTINQQLVQVGSRRFMEKEEISIPSKIKSAEELGHQQGHSLVMVAINKRMIGAIEVFPTVRPEAKAVIDKLRQGQIKSMYIISGDQEIPTQKLAQDLGIDHYFAQVLPQNKAEIIEQLQKTGKTVCYIGDGINDAIALKKAQVSISMRGASTVATDTAQIILMSNLNQLAHLFDLAQEFEKNMRISFKAMIAPTMIGMGGAVFLGFGLVETMLLKQTGLVVSLANATRPLVKYQGEKRIAN
jgi:Cu2+-exporting ATPase